MSEHVQSPEAREAQEELALEKRVRDEHNANALAAQRAEVHHLQSKAFLRYAAGLALVSLNGWVGYAVIQWLEAR